MAANLQAAVDLAEAARQSAALAAPVARAVVQSDWAVVVVVLAAWVENAELEAFDLAEVTDKVAEVDEPAAGLAAAAATGVAEMAAAGSAAVVMAAAGLAAAGSGLKVASRAVTAESTVVIVASCPAGDSVVEGLAAGLAADSAEVVSAAGSLEQGEEADSAEVVVASTAVVAVEAAKVAVEVAKAAVVEEVAEGPPLRRRRQSCSPSRSQRKLCRRNSSPRSECLSTASTLRQASYVHTGYPCCLRACAGTESRQ